MLKQKRRNQLYQGQEKEAKTGQNAVKFSQKTKNKQTLRIRRLSKNCQCLSDDQQQQLQNNQAEKIGIKRRRQSTKDDFYYYYDVRPVKKSKQVLHTNGQKNDQKSIDKLFIKKPGKNIRKRSLCEPLQISMFKKLLIKLKSQVSKILQLLHLVETYQSTGWKNSQIMKIKLTPEVERAKQQIHNSMEIIRGVVRECDNCEGDAQLDDDLFGGSGEIFCESIVCCRCCIPSPASNYNEDDVVLCDADGCRRAYHTKCINPQVDLSSLGANEGWMCPSCDCKFDIVRALYDAFDLTYCLNTPWYDILPDINELMQTPPPLINNQLEKSQIIQKINKQKIHDIKKNGCTDNSTKQSDWRQMLEKQLYSDDESDDLDFEVDDKNIKHFQDDCTEDDNDDLTAEFDYNCEVSSQNDSKSSKTVVFEDVNLKSIELGKRERSRINYKSLNQRLFGKLSDLNYESDENDDDYQP